MLSTGSKREFTKMRHAQRRDLVRACQAAVKGSSWRSNKGTLFAHRSGWLVGVTELTNVTCEQTKARIAVKPMANDPMYFLVLRSYLGVAGIRSFAMSRFRSVSSAG